MKCLWLPFVLIPVLAGLQSLAAADADHFVYPQATKGTTVDTYFGTKVDPYRELENADTEATKKWIEAENKRTFDYLAGIPERKRINDKLTALWNYEKYTERFIASYLKDAHSAIQVFELSGKPAGEVQLPGLGTASGFKGKRKDTETFYSYVSFTDRRQFIVTT